MWLDIATENTYGSTGILGTDMSPVSDCAHTACSALQ